MFVPGVLPGERVRIRIAQRRGDYDRAVLVEVLEASPHRVVPGLPVRGALRRMRLAAHQLRGAASSEGLHRDGGPAPDRDVSSGRILPIEPSEPWRTRNRAQVHRGPAGGLGYMGARSARVIPVDACPIVAPSIERLFRGEARPPIGLERFTVFGDGEMLAVEGGDDGRDLAVEVGGRGSSFRSAASSSRTSRCCGSSCRGPWRVSREGRRPTCTAASGCSAAFLASRFARIICVESSAMSLAYARRNVPGASHEFYPMSVEQWIRSACSVGTAGRGHRRSAARGPQRGGPGVAHAEPASAARVRVVQPRHPGPRPRGLAAPGGLTLEDLRLFDFYPQTSHVEAVAKLARGGSEPALRRA